MAAVLGRLEKLVGLPGGVGVVEVGDDERVGAIGDRGRVRRTLGLVFALLVLAGVPIVVAPLVSELPAPTVEDLKAFAECKAEKEEERGGKWRGQGHKGQAGRAVEKRRRRAKLARASRRRR